MIKIKQITNAPMIPLGYIPEVNDKNFDKAVETVLNEITKNQVRKRKQQYRQSARHVVFAIMSAITPFLRYPKSTGNERDEILFHDEINITNLRKVIDTVVQLGWVRYMDYKTEVLPHVDGKAQSRIEILKDHPVFSSSAVTEYDWSQYFLVRIRKDASKTGTDIFSYSEVDIKDDIELLTKHNQLLHAAEFSIDNKPVIFTMPVHRGIKSVKDNKLLNGRFDGGFWLRIRSEDRKKIKIDGEEVVEYDFSSMYLRALYHLKGIQLDTTPDPYQYTTITRIEAKLLTNSLFFIKKRNRVSSLKKTLSKNRGLDVDQSIIKDFLDEFDKRHSKIEDKLFDPSIGAELMWRESLISRDLINHFNESDDIVLDVHDGFMVKKSLAARLVRMMSLYYQVQYTQLPHIKAVKGDEPKKIISRMDITSL